MVNTENTLVLDGLRLDQVNIILAGLGKLPAEQSIELILQIKSAAESQLKEADNTRED